MSRLFLFLAALGRVRTVTDATSTPRAPDDWPSINQSLSPEERATIKLFCAEHVVPEPAEPTNHKQSLLGGAQGSRHGKGYSFPSSRLGVQLLLAGFGQRIGFRAPVGFRFAPERGEPAGLFHAVQRGEQGSGFHVESSARDLRYSARYTRTVQFLKSKRLQDEQIESALQQIGLRAGIDSPIVVL